MWRHKCDYHLRRELVKKPPHNELMDSPKEPTEENEVNLHKEINKLHTALL